MASSGQSRTSRMSGCTRAASSSAASASCCWAPSGSRQVGPRPAADRCRRAAGGRRPAGRSKPAATGLLGRPAERLAGLLEVRGLGILRLPYCRVSPLGLVVELDAARPRRGCPSPHLPAAGHRAAPSPARSARGLGLRQGPPRASRRAGRLSGHDPHRPGDRHVRRGPHDRAQGARGRRLRGGRQPPIDLLGQPAQPGDGSSAISRSASTAAPMPSIRRGLNRRLDRTAAQAPTTGFAAVPRLRGRDPAAALHRDAPAASAGAGSARSPTASPASAC